MDLTELVSELLGNTLIAGFLAALAIAACAGLARRLNVPAPLLLVLLGIAVSFVPGAAIFDLPPNLILQGVLPPLLYSSAVSMPAMDFRRDFTAIGGLSVVLVALTAVAVGFGLHYLLPQVPLAICIALGAILSPTDAVAVGIVERLGAPHRIITILEGEALINDASALAIMTTALVAGGVEAGGEMPAFITDNVPALANDAAIGPVWIGAHFIWMVLIAVAVGFAVGKIGLWVNSKTRDTAVSILVTFLISFAAYIPVEHLGGSGLVAAVVAGLVNGQGGPKRISAHNRSAQAHVWETVEFILEGVVFLLMGLQIKTLLDTHNANGGKLWTTVGIALITGLIVLAVRGVFVAPLVKLLQIKAARLAKRREKVVGQAIGRQARVAQLREEALRKAAGGSSRGQAHTVAKVRRLVGDVNYLAGNKVGAGEGAVVVWAGMRGVVTLAAALALPTAFSEGGPDLPRRATLILIAFIVAATSLFIQAGTLPMLLRKTGLTGRDPVSEAVERDKLERRLARAAATYLTNPELRRSDGLPYSPETIATVCDVLSIDPDTPTGPEPEPLFTMSEAIALTEERLRVHEEQAELWELRLGVVRAMRADLLLARGDGTYNSEALKEALEELDADEISIELRHQGGAASPG